MKHSVQILFPNLPFSVDFSNETQFLKLMMDDTGSLPS